MGENYREGGPCPTRRCGGTQIRLFDGRTAGQWKAAEEDWKREVREVEARLNETNRVVYSGYPVSLAGILALSAAGGVLRRQMWGRHLALAAAGVGLIGPLFGLLGPPFGLLFSAPAPVAYGVAMGLTLLGGHRAAEYV